jgi:hypothetical protein
MACRKYLSLDEARKAKKLLRGPARKSVGIVFPATEPRKNIDMTHGVPFPRYPWTMKNQFPGNYL